MSTTAATAPSTTPSPSTALSAPARLATIVNSRVLATAAPGDHREPSGA